MEMITHRMAVTAHLMRQEADRRMAAIEGSVPEFLVLTAAAETPGLSQREIAERIGIERTTLSHHLDRFEAAGLVERSRDAKDRRILRVTTTAAGRRRAKTLMAIARSVEDDVREALSEKDAAALARLLRRVHDHFHDEPKGDRPWPKTTASPSSEPGGSPRRTRGASRR